MLTIVVAFAGLLVGWFARGVLRPSAATGGAAPRSVMVLFDGVNWCVGPAELVKGSDKMPAVELRGLGHTLPLSSAIELVLPGLTLYVYTISRPLLLEQDALQAARETVDMAALFTGGGQPRQWLAMAGAVVPLVVVVLVWFQVGGIASTVASVAESNGAIKAAVVDAPVTCRVVP